MGGKVFKYEVLDELSDEAVAEVLRALPEWRREKAEAFKRPLDRFLCAEAYLLLRDALRDEYGLNDEFSFVYGPAGKPALKEFPDIHFNLSHCSKCVCCAVSSSPVGVDVEDVQYDPALAKAILNTAEIEAVETAERQDIAFTRLWTMKESALKLNGCGLGDDLKELLAGETLSFDIEICAEHGYVLCLAENR